MIDVPFQGSQAKLVSIFQRLLDEVGEAGRDIVEGIQIRAANALLSEIQIDFLVKSRGGTGRDGIKWKPLKPETIARRRLGGEDVAALKAKGVGVVKRGHRYSKNVAVGHNVGLLKDEQAKQYRRLYREEFVKARWTLTKEAAENYAARRAWNAVSKEGVSRLALLGSRQVDILQDTGLLYGSLTPGAEGMRSEAEGQIVRLTAGAVTVGSNVKPWHHAGIPGKLPSRPLWPLSGEIPEPWMAEIMAAVEEGIVLALMTAARRGGSG